VKNNRTLDELRKSACAHLNPHLFENPKKEDKICPTKGVKKCNTKKGQKTKEWIGKNLWAWCYANKLELLTEYPFHEERKWRFDWCILALKVAIEYEGVMSEKSRHTTVTGFTGDSEKYNAAQSLGWIVLRYTVLNYKTLLQDLEKIK